MANYNIVMKSFMEITRAFSDESRVRILTVLSRGELCVCQITELLQLAPSTVSKHLSILHHAGIVDARKNGRWVYYRIAGNRKAPPAAREGIRWLLRSLEGSDRVKRDFKALDRILKIDPERLCKAQVKR